MCNRYAFPHETEFVSTGTIFMTPRRAIFP